MQSLKQFLKRVVGAILEGEARLVLRRYKPKIIAITGSVGKTSTKDATYSVFKASQFVRKSEKSFNSDIGVPLTILGCPNGWSNPLMWLQNFLIGLDLIFLKNTYPKWLVLEVGADRPGDIKKIARWVTPDIAVVTRLPDVPVHVEFFPSPEALFKEKSNLVRYAKQGAVTILNADDERVLGMRSLAKGKVLTYGFSPEADVIASHMHILYRTEGEQTLPEGMTFRVDHDGHSVPVSLFGVIGVQSVYAALAAITAGISAGMNLVSIGDALAEHSFAPARMRLIEGIKQTLVIDDTYNASPIAEQEALAILGKIEHAGRKIAVLGDMLELGRYSVEEHKEAGRRAAAACDVLLTVGFRARSIAEGALDAGLHESKIFQYEDARAAGKELQEKLIPGDIVLVKGSQSMRMERIVEEVMLHPEDREKLLVRQEKEWRGRN